MTTCGCFLPASALARKAATGGGEIVAARPPEATMQERRSYAGRYFPLSQGLAKKVQVKFAKVSRGANREMTSTSRDSSIPGAHTASSSYFLSYSKNWHPDLFEQGKEPVPVPSNLRKEMQHLVEMLLVEIVTAAESKEISDDQGHA
jgi:hypothetical protein